MEKTLIRPDSALTSVRSTKRVLLVEDNEDNRIIYAMILEHHGYEVVMATTGEDAVRIVGDGMPDLILMDISLPGMNGWTATQRVREIEGGNDIPIIALTAHVLPEHRRHAELIGLNGFIPKPCEPRRLLEEVRRHIGDPPPLIEGSTPA